MEAIDFKNIGSSEDFIEQYSAAKSFLAVVATFLIPRLGNGKELMTPEQTRANAVRLVTNTRKAMARSVVEGVVMDAAIAVTATVSPSAARMVALTQRCCTFSPEFKVIIANVKCSE